MGKDKLLTAAVIFLLVGIVGIFSTKLAGRYGGCVPGGRMMGMMSRDEMRGMMGEMMKINIPPGITFADLPDRESEGAKLTAKVCSQCHYLPSPSMHTAKEWREITGRMFSRLTMMSGRRMRGMMKMMRMKAPSPGEEKIIADYIMGHSLEGIEPSALPDSESQGAKLFVRVCSECHQLPDITQHTEDEWPGVVKRMEGHMQTMGQRVITRQERDEITGYLGKNARKQ